MLDLLYWEMQVRRDGSSQAEQPMEVRSGLVSGNPAEAHSALWMTSTALLT
jgi:hypothetical protein